MIPFKTNPSGSNTLHKGSKKGIIGRVKEICYSEDKSKLNILEEVYYNLLAHVSEYTNEASKDKLPEEEEELQLQKKIN